MHLSRNARRQNRFQIIPEPPARRIPLNISTSLKCQKFRCDPDFRRFPLSLSEIAPLNNSTLNISTSFSASQRFSVFFRLSTSQLLNLFEHLQSSAKEPDCLTDHGQEKKVRILSEQPGGLRNNCPSSQHATKNSKNARHRSAAHNCRRPERDRDSRRNEKHAHERLVQKSIVIERDLPSRRVVCRCICDRSREPRSN